ncbi:DUF4280 domain-containing protein [Corallococcus praedator]|uniref:DUF4280 domain-containing protein n=1 Tax=Corallococcus praedator TaxID=2316724 RepID=A0ABX9QEF7_9BACT|nr:MULTISPECIES: DUF4280 domain-containing protein [Corallococcus]RKH12226.1 DUF4280 domain-containing protein [Corallococcus sp. CA047B]RKH25623.1 DUF4280 domain-containing protein [Corallococcus sp. CA031C]RKI02915.1 DUF4280 domain-containing protein [Corallococcus praedator]
MGIQVVSGALLQCSFGLAPSTLSVPPVNQVNATAPAATIMDNIPGMNVPPFGMCQSMANPAVVAATAAALGVLTPMPCMPVPVAPWAPGSPTVLIKGKPALTDTSLCNCAYGGIIKINMAGQVKAQVK